MSGMQTTSWWRSVGTGIASVQRSLFPECECKTDRVVRWLILLDLVLLIVLTWSAYDPLVVFAALLAGNAVGAIFGLLFAVPRRARGTTQVAISGNTSLEDVSDWLTKTIIGAGLVSWAAILRQLDESGDFVGVALAPFDVELARAGGVAMLLASSALGALIGYLWFARHWPSELAGADMATHNILSKIAAIGQKQETADVAPPTPTLGPGTGTAGGGQGPVGDGQAAAGGEAGEGEAKAPAGGQLKAAAEEMEQPSNQHESLRTKVFEKYARMRAAPLVREDWAKGMFGGQAARSTAFGERRLSATVKKIEADWFEVNLVVEARERPETDAVFFLHNTFSQPTPTVGFDEQGVAKLTVSAWGAFTVGVLLDDGSTELELDLSQLPGAPATFRNR